MQNMAYLPPNGSVSFVWHCGKIYSRHLLSRGRLFHNGGYVIISLRNLNFNFILARDYNSYIFSGKLICVHGVFHSNVMVFSFFHSGQLDRSDKNLLRPRVSSCFDEGCPTKVHVKAYATMPTGIMGSKSLALLD